MRARICFVAALLCACFRQTDGSRAQFERETNEIHAFAMLHNLVSAQAQLQAVGLVDEDQDGLGEYGGLAELAGMVGLRGGRRLDPPVLGEAVGQFRQGCVERSGYYLRVLLPGKSGQLIPERDSGGFAAGVLDPQRCEREWCCYAWPVRWGETGSRTYFVDQWGDIMVTDAPYSGDRAPAAQAFVSAAQPLGHGRATDGHAWRPALPQR